MRTVVQVVGFKNSGKTYLIERMIEELKMLGLRPIVVKTTHHTLKDTDRGDTRRFLEAGAEETLLLAPDGVRLQVKRETSLEDVIESLEGLVIVEGGREVKKREWLGIAVIRRDDELPRLARPRTFAVVRSGPSLSREAKKLARWVAAVYKAQLSRAAFTAQHSANSS